MSRLRDRHWWISAVLLPIAAGLGLLVVSAVGLVAFVLCFGALDLLIPDGPSVPAEVNEAREAECDPGGGGATVAPSISSDYWGAAC